MAELTHLTTRTIELLAAGEPNEAARVHAAACAACGERLARAVGQKAAYLAQNPPSVRAAQLLDAHARRSPRPVAVPPAVRWWRWLVPAASVAAAAAAVLVLRPGQPRPPAGPPQSEILEKGGPSVSLTRQARGGGNILPAKSGDSFLPGDSVQLHVTLAAPTTVRVFELDAGGERRLVLEERRERSGPLSSSLVIDDTPGAVRLLVVVGEWSQSLLLQKRAK